MKKDDKVISLQEFRGEKLGDHSAGWVQCFGCQHKWLATSPVGTYQYECPECGTFKGRGMYECIRVDELHLVCECGNAFFSITHDGFYCPNCGVGVDKDDVPG